MIRHIFYFMALALLVGVVSAQPSELDRSRLNTAAFYNYTEPGDVTIKVHVWGAIRFPGLYQIPRDTRLSELLSLAGGPQFAERSQRSTRSVDMKLHRANDGVRDVIFRSQMTNEIVVREEDPVIQNGDVLTFEATIRQGFRWRDLFPIVSMVGTLVLIIDRVAGE